MTALARRIGLAARAAAEEIIELPFRETAMVTLTDKEERG